MLPPAPGYERRVDWRPSINKDGNWGQFMTSVMTMNSPLRSMCRVTGLQSVKRSGANATLGDTLIAVGS